MIPYQQKSIGDMVGMTFSNVSRKRNTVVFQTEDGKKFTFQHHQCCCESVYIEDINGDLCDLEDVPLTRAYESSDNNPNASGRERWTFYHFASEKGYVTIRFHGTSNGYYSVSVQCDYSEPILTTYVCSACGKPCGIIDNEVLLACGHDTWLYGGNRGTPIPIEEYQERNP